MTSVSKLEMKYINLAVNRTELESTHAVRCKLAKWYLLLKPLISNVVFILGNFTNSFSRSKELYFNEW